MITLILINTEYLYPQTNVYLSNKFIQVILQHITVRDLVEENTVFSKSVIQSPLTRPKTTSLFGWRKHPVTGQYGFHQGVDLVSEDKIVRNILDGVVSTSGYHTYLGNYVRVNHGKLQSVYGHLSFITVQEGQSILSGYPIGIIGNTGRVTGEHLHFGLMYNGIYIDPWQFLQSLTNNNSK
ncbi:M23 family metallopeptidase [Sphingobacterium sp. SGL-16]|nr:M23 family metallopeptidase [Sphingobacterium sp. SGL-16]